MNLNKNDFKLLEHTANKSVYIHRFDKDYHWLNLNAQLVQLFCRRFLYAYIYAQCITT